MSWDAHDDNDSSIAAQCRRMCSTYRYSHGLSLALSYQSGTKRKRNKAIHSCTAPKHTDTKHNRLHHSPPGQRSVTVSTMQCVHTTRLGLVITVLVISTKLLYVELG